MSEKRKDSKGRVLRNGEAQRADGKYMFRYSDMNGERQTAYSWKLVETDKVPAGKRCTEALRTIERRVLKDIEDGIDTDKAENTVVNMLFAEFMALRTELKESTRCNYICLYDTHVRNGFGKRRISSVKYSDVYKFYMSLSKDKKLKISTIQAINAILWQVFEMSVRDNDIRRNPVAGVMIDVARKLKEEPDKRHALTVDEQSELLDYIYSSNKYKRYGVLFTTLLGTGMRIGEALGLRWCDVDFQNGMITVDHSLSYKDTETGGYRYKISAPKTKAGIRTIPMFYEVKRALQEERHNKKDRNLKPFVIDGFKGFIFLNSAGKVYTPTFIYDTIQNIVTDYNHDELANARKEGREPHFLPKISAHILRHTFCTRMCENESNLKVIQDVMGHKNIRTTMNVYSEATIQAKQKSFENLEGRIKLR
ncbi:MAG: site-specific integrase [Firmicutes bacterium]|nr:site-specific integrase [Bacillota bacterium]